MEENSALVSRRITACISSVARISDETSTHDKIALFNAFVSSLKSPYYDYDQHILPIEEEFVNTLRIFAADHSRSICAGVYRVFRYASRPNCSLVTALRNTGVTFMILRALERDKNADLERVEAVKLIRTLIEHSPQLVPTHLVTSIASMAMGRSNDSMRVLFLEELNKLLLVNPRVVTRGGGVAALLSPADDPVQHVMHVMQQIVVNLLILVADDRTRVYLRPDTALQSLLGPLNDHPPPRTRQVDETRKLSQTHRQRLQLAKLALVTMASTWSGLILLGSTTTGLRAVVRALLVSTDADARETVFASLFDIFGLTPAECSALTGILKNHSSRPQDLPAPTIPQGVAAAFMAFTVTTFMHAGLLDVLIEIGCSDDPAISIPAVVLLGHIMFLADVLLPDRQRVSIATLSSLITSASGTAGPRSVALLSQLNTLSAARRSTDPHLGHLAVIRGRVGLIMQHESFVDSLKGTLVGSHRPSQWLWHQVHELLMCQLQNSTKLSVAIQEGWVKRLFSFFDFSKGAFAPHPQDLLGRTMSTCGVLLLELMVSDDTARAYLFDQCGFFLQSIQQALASVIANPTDSTNILSTHRMSHTLAGDIFTFVGVLSRFHGGSALQEARIMSELYGIASLDEREDLIRAMIQALDYSSDGHTRILLGTVMTSFELRSVRFWATAHLSTVLKQEGPASFSWAIDLLVTQLFDPSAEVVAASLQVLVRACKDPYLLDELVKRRPNIVNVCSGSQGDGLTMRLLGTDAGLQYLVDVGWIEPELHRWVTKAVYEYPILVDRALKAAVHSTPGTKGQAGLPPHLIAELCATAAGVEMVRKSEIVQTMVPLLEIGSEHLRAALWMLALIGGTERGCDAFILDEEADGPPTSRIIERIVNIAETAPNFDDRGAAFLAVGQLHSPKAVAVVESLGWDVHRTLSLAVPRETTRVIHMAPYRFIGSPLGPDFGVGACSDPTADGEAGSGPDPSRGAEWGVQEAADLTRTAVEVCYSGPRFESEAEQAAYEAIQLAQNPVSQDESLGRLRAIRARYPQLFLSGRLLIAATNLFGLYRCRDTVRRSVLAQFDHVPPEECFEVFDDMRACGELFLD
ncbi:Rapamycin-insensitive companion of mTOR RICTR [Carpediemonas membranifera]|uniref:Rapamycin-insensitive companion of mTOR RICTR n=1 Tax=Carpediemonas membranifera TaxID=201153 RepID=A0A8J6E0H8_9EUKA|nr:Rapamycin-insensitive companion of mTOR RICTR [Carpediemonas membranifera]|eukprot:KAG9395139.1 Rapamycin-insensitive companion of mTOR RICTR [Carpediemonas membranifera]